MQRDVSRPWPHWNALAIAGALLCLVSGRAAGLSHPVGAGAARVERHGESIRLFNRAIDASWRVATDGPRLDAVRDVETGERIVFGGELFQIRLAEGGSYGIPDWVRQGDVRVVKARGAVDGGGGRSGGRMIEADYRSVDGRLLLGWRAILRDETAYVRVEILIRAARDGESLKEIVWCDTAMEHAGVAGRVDGSPLVNGRFFFGAEDPMSHNEATASRVVCRLPLAVPLVATRPVASSFVLGTVPEEGQLRRGFLRYLEGERAHPYRTFLHYNSWYDISWDPFALNETNCLEAIQICGERFIRPYGVVMDSMVFDDGWDNPRSLWQFHDGFPRGFSPHAALCKRYGTRLGVWLSPFGGYGGPKEQRLRFGAAQGFETNGAGFSLAGAKYSKAFRDACIGMMRRYGVNYFKFDGIAAGMYADGSAQYTEDTEAMRALMLDLRREDPKVYINLTTGSWPSPFWLRYADSLWRQGGDMGQAGKGNAQQQWLTYRDQEVRRNIVGKSPLFPLSSLMTQGVAYSRHGTAGEPTFDSRGFKDDVRAFFGSGTGLQELYIQPGKLSAEDWRVLAEAARWSRANSDVLADTHWIGGDPGKLEVYGYASWSARKGIVMLRNPDDTARTFRLALASAFQLPFGAPRDYTLRSPWAEDAGKVGLRLVAGTAGEIVLGPFEVLVLEAKPIRP